MKDPRPGIAVITRKTRLQNLLGRYSTRGQVKFRMSRAKWRDLERSQQKVTQEAMTSGGEDFDLLQEEDDLYQASISTLQQELDFGLPVQLVDRDFVPNFDFARFEVVVVIGQDGLVANAAKYVGDKPIVAINPDPEHIDGILLPFRLRDAPKVVRKVLDGRYTFRTVTLAEAALSDGQRLLAFNDLFLGASSHVSARYKLVVHGREEQQSSSGIIVSTGAGSTGWMSSVFNMAAGISTIYGAGTFLPPRITWEDRCLIWAVREPFVSRSSSADLVVGQIEEGQMMSVESMMASGGVIFSDGVESDFLEFNSGTVAHISVSRQRAKLVTKA